MADRAAVALPYSPDRIALAERDQIVDPFVAFAETLGTGFLMEAMPATTRLLAEVQYRAAVAVTTAKEMFPRQRPFVATPALARCSGAVFLESNRSYPSGHATIGQAWAALLAALLPGRARDILARGTDYGLSRVVCGVHWPSDVAAGQALGNAVAEAFITDPAHAGLLDAARLELGALTGP